jgi:Zn-dependent protease/CBS domain-containing protein
LGGSITVVRIAGIPVRIHVSWIFVLALLVWSLGASVFPDAYPHWIQTAYWVTAVVATLLFFLSVLAHELSHSVVALARGVPVASITLFIFGGVSQIEEDARTPGAEFWITIVGPLSSLGIGAVCLALSTAVGSGSPQVKATLEYLGSVNLILGVFNMIPGFPLDGGRVLRSAVWGATHSMYRATVVAASVSRFVAFLMIFGGVIATFTGVGWQGLWIAFIGWFLDNAASSSLQQTSIHAVLGNARVRDAMRTDVATVVPALPVSSLVDDYIKTGHQRGFPVYGGGKLWGIVTLADVAHVSRDRWTETRVEEIMTPRERLRTTDADTRLESVFEPLQHAGVKQLIVVEKDTDGVAGLLSRADLLDFLKVRQLVTRPP